MKRKTTKTPTTPTKYDTQAEKVLNLLIAKLEAGVNAWRKPWDCKGNPTDNADFFAVNLFTGRPYTGINAQTLPAGLYAGFSQITSHGGKVKKGSNAYPVTWFGSFEKDLEDEQEQQKIWQQFDANKAKITSGKYGPCYQIRIGFYGVYNVYLDENCDLEKVTCICKVLKFESVFRVEDTEGLEKFVERWNENHKPTDTTEKPFNEIEAGDLWIEAYCEQAKLGGFYYDGGNRSYYIPARDEIHVSKRTNYHTPADFYSTAFHEMTHSTGHASRLSRVGITNSDGFGGDRYAKEELVAEMGASMAMGFLGIETSGTLDNSAAYLASWLHQKVNEKASKKVLETLMAASSSAKYAFAYIAEMYEAAKARKEEENKQKKQEEPAPLPMLPAIIAPTATTVAAVFKAEPAAPRYEFLQQPNALLLCNIAKTDPETRDYVVVWSICESDLSEDTNEAEFSALPESLKEQIKKERFERIHRKAQLLAKGPFIEPKGASTEFPELIGFSESFGGYVSVKENGEKVTYKMPDFFKKYRLIDRKTMRACYRMMPNGEGSSPTAPTPLVGVTQKFDICYHYGKDGVNEVMETIDAINFEEAQRYADKLTNHIMSIDQLEGDYYFAKYHDARVEALSEFWVNVEDSTAVRVREGDGTNLSDEDMEAGYVDYIYYDTFEACDGLNIAERAENDDNSDGGMILLEKPYNSYTTLEIASKVVDFTYGMVGNHEPDWKWSEDAPKFEEPDREHYNDGMIDHRNIQEFCRIVFTNCDGDTKVVGYDDNFFAPIDLLKAYKSLISDEWGLNDTEKETLINNYKKYLVKTGVKPEELEEE